LRENDYGIAILGQIIEHQNDSLTSVTYNGVLIFSALDYQYLAQIDTSAAAPYYDLKWNPGSNTFALAHTYGVDFLHCCNLDNAEFLSNRQDNYALAWDPSGKLLISNVGFMDLQSGVETRFPEPRYASILRWRPYSDQVFVGDRGDAALLSISSIDGLNLSPVSKAGPGQILNTIGQTASVNLSAEDSYDPDGTIELYSWTELVNGNLTPIATGATPTVDLSAGTHTITLTVTDDEGATDSDEVVVVVNAP
jgi:hypothetical protein